MNTNPFNLLTVVSQINLEQPGSKIEVLELKVGILYIGTTDGWLLQYGLVERRSEQGNHLLQANFIQRKNIGEKSKITFIHAAPVINTLLVVCSGNLYILNMSDLTPRAGLGNKLKGISACAINHSNMDQFSVHFCLARRKQLTMYSLNEEKLTALRSREVSEPVVSLCVDGDTLCAALPSRYILLNWETGSLIDLFPIEENSPPLAITRIDHKEFLLAGPGNLGMFVTSEGTSVRPPIQWTANLYRIVYSYPYIIGLSPESVVVYSITDQKLKQGLPFPGGRTIGVFDGTILLAGSLQVSSLLPVPWEIQAENLLSRQSVDDVLHLIDSVMSTPNLSHDSLEKIQILKQRSGFICLSKGELTRASELLMSGKTDVRELLSLYPGLLSENSEFVRRDPPLHDIPDILSVQPNTSEPSLNQFLLEYLTTLVEVEGYSPEYGEDVYTALAKVLAEEDGGHGLPAFLDREDIILHYEELTEFLQARGLVHFQAMVHDKFRDVESACSLWSSLVSSSAKDQTFPGIEFFVRKLCEEAESTVWTYCDAVLTADQRVGVLIFTKHKHADLPSFIEQALNILSKYKLARKLFLEDLVFDKNSQVEKHHTLLALMLIEAHDSPEETEKLRKLILTSSYLNTQFLIDKLRDTDLLYERSILHGRLGQYDQALNILVNNMKDHALALRFCDDIAAAKNKKEKEKMLYLLLVTYLNPLNPTDKEDFLVKAVDLINSRAAEFNGVQVLNSLPGSWNIATILPAIRVFLRDQSHMMKMTKLTKYLSKGENLNVHVEYVGLSREGEHIQPNHYCITCKKGFGVGGVGRYPNGVLVHAECIANKEICPLTGEVFKLKL